MSQPFTVPSLRAGTEEDASLRSRLPVVQKSGIPISTGIRQWKAVTLATASSSRATCARARLTTSTRTSTTLSHRRSRTASCSAFGVDAERNDFGLPDHIALPNTLMSTNLVIGADIAVTDKILFRAELHPGIYSDFTRITGDDFDVPVQFGATYLYSKDLQIILGGQIDLKSDVPFIVIPGIRWQFADDWVLSAHPAEAATAILAEQGDHALRRGRDHRRHLPSQRPVWHRPRQHDSSRPGRSLNDKIVDFNEDRVGVGATWKFQPNLTLDVSTGYVAYREFDIHEDPGLPPSVSTGTIYHQNIGDGAPYGGSGESAGHSSWKASRLLPSSTR